MGIGTVAVIRYGWGTAPRPIPGSSYAGVGSGVRLHSVIPLCLLRWLSRQRFTEPQDINQLRLVGHDQLGIVFQGGLDHLKLFSSCALPTKNLSAAADTFSIALASPSASNIAACLTSSANNRDFCF